MAPSKKFALVFLLVAAAAAGVPELVFKSGAGSMSIKYDGVSLDVPGYSRTTDVAALRKQVEALETAVAKSGAPQGAILMWSGSVASIPTGWALCDGGNGTPNLLNRFVSSIPDPSTDPGTTGGSNTHNMGHTHQFSSSTASAAAGQCNRGEHPSWCGGPRGNYNRNVIGTHSHTYSGTTNAAMQSMDIRPEYFEVAFIMKL